MNRFNSVKKAQSSIISNLMLIAASVGLSSIVFFWGLSMLSESQGTYSRGIYQSNSKIGEQFEVEETYWNPSGSVTFYIRNFGDQAVTIDRVIIDGSPQTVSSVVVTPRNVSPLTVSFSWTSETRYTIRIGSNRGTYHDLEATAP